MPDIVHRLEKELLEKPYNWVKRSARDIAFFGTVTVPANVSEKLGEYGVNSSAANEAISKANDMVNQTVDDTLSRVDAKYGLDESLRALGNINDAAGRVNTVMDPNGVINGTSLNATLDRVNAAVMERVMQDFNTIGLYVQQEKDKLINSIVHDPRLYIAAAAVIGVAFLTLFAAVYFGSYYGTARALREYNKRS